MANVMTEEVSSLDIITANKFDGDFDQERIQTNFYKGAPPQWVNFYLAEKNEMPFVKRDGYNDIKNLVETSHKRKAVTMVTLLHEPGSGGSTLAMQVLWDLQKKFQCAKLATQTVLDPTVIANDVIKLVTMRNKQTGKGGKPVLLLIDNAETMKESLSKTLQKQLIEKLNGIPDSLSVIILKCVRKSFTEFTDCDQHNIVLLREQKTEEKKEFNQHQTRISQLNKNDHKSFHGFNIVHDFINSEKYTTNLCQVIVPPKRNNRPRKDQLFAILALVQKYAPGSDFLLDQCEKFLCRSDTIHRHPSFEDQMGKFSDLLVTYTNFERNINCVRVAHPMIADKCVELFSKHGLSMGEVTYLFLQNFCAENVSPSLMQTTKTMLTLREMRDNKGEKDKFSKLIQDIYDRDGEGERMCTRLLKAASEIFEDRPTFPQALARCYYLMVNKKNPVSREDEKNYINAGKWAREAIKRHPNNSFIMDTLGQAYKHQLIHHIKTDPQPSEVLKFGRLAIRKFQEEEIAAEKEEAEENAQEADVNTSPTFNMRGKLGYLQVAELLAMDKSLNLKCRNVFADIKAGVKKRLKFFEKYLTYSKPDYLRDDPPYIRKCADICYTNYVGPSPKILKLKFDKEVELEMLVMGEDVITTLDDLKTFFRKHRADHSPELYHLDLLKSAEGQDFSNVVKKMREAYKNLYEKYLRSRYLVPLYMKTTDGWQTLSKLQLQPQEIEKGVSSDADENEDDKDLEQRLANLMRIEGRIAKPNILAFIGNTLIPVEPHNTERVLRNGSVSFYMGFNIKGPVAFNIRYERE